MCTCRGRQLSACTSLVSVAALKKDPGCHRHIHKKNGICMTLQQYEEAAVTAGQRITADAALVVDVAQHVAHVRGVGGQSVHCGTHATQRSGWQSTEVTATAKPGHCSQEQSGHNALDQEQKAANTDRLRDPTVSAKPAQYNLTVQRAISLMTKAHIKPSQETISWEKLTSTMPVGHLKAVHCTPTHSTHCCCCTACLMLQADSRHDG